MSESVPPFAASRLSVNALAQPLLARLLAEADALGVAVRRDASGVRIVDAGIEARGSVDAGLLIAEICMGGLGSVRLGRRRPRRLADLARGAAARSPCSPAWPASTPAGASRRARRRPAARSSSRSARARRARSPARRRCSASSATATAPTSGVLVLEVDRVAAGGRRRQGAARLRPGARGPDLHPHADDEPRRHDAGGGARARGRAAQGARARLRRSAHIVEGVGARAAAGAEPRRRRGDGPHQRRDPLRRPRAPDGARRRCRGARARRRAAVAQLARPRRAPSPRSSSRSSTTSTRSTARCSRRPRSGSATSTRGSTWHAGAARHGAAAAAVDEGVIDAASRS